MTVFCQKPSVFAYHLWHKYW